MNTVRESKPFTAEELFRLGEDARYELIEGELVEMAPPGEEHAVTTQLLSSYATVYVDQRGLGRALGEAGVVVSRNPDTVLAPDFAFFRSERVPSKPVKGYLTAIPDLVLETRSPADSKKEIAEKVAAWLAAGVAVVWVLDPGARTLAVHRAGGDVVILAEGDTLTGESLLPGFTFELSRLFA